MYAGRIFDVKTSKIVTGVLFPWLHNSFYTLSIRFYRGRLLFEPHEYEDLALIKYHTLIDRLYDLSEYVESIQVDAPRTIPRDFTPKWSTMSLPKINYSNRIRKLEYIAEEFFLDLQGALEALNESFSKNRSVVSKCAYYTRGVRIPLGIKVPPLIVKIKVASYLPDEFILSFSKGGLVFRVNALPINACAAFSMFGNEMELEKAILHMIHIARPKLSTYVYRKAVSATRAFPFDEVPMPSSNTEIFYRVEPIVINVYEFLEKYSTEFTLSKLLEKSRTPSKNKN